MKDVNTCGYGYIYVILYVLGIEYVVEYDI